MFYFYIIIFLIAHSRKGILTLSWLFYRKYDKLCKYLVQWGILWRWAKVFWGLKTYQKEICGVIQAYVFYSHWNIIEFGYLYGYFKSRKKKKICDLKNQLAAYALSSVDADFSKLLSLYITSTRTRDALYISQASFSFYFVLFLKSK